MAHKKQTHYIVGQIERGRIATLLLQQDGILNLKLVILLRLHLTMHISLTVCRAADLLSNIASPSFSQNIQQNLSMVDRKRRLMMLSQGSNEVYPGDNVIFWVNISKARIIK